MDEKRNLGVTEARFALTILTCLLVAIGYIALLRLGGTKDNSLDVSPEDVSRPTIAGQSTQPSTEPVPIVLPLDKPDDGRNELAKRPPSVQQTPEPERR